jgi:phage protein U
MGMNLQEQNIKLNFHNSFCVPEDEIKKLKTVANKAEPLKFIKGNGEYVGVFVLSEIISTTEQTSKEGDLISVQVDLKLREYTGKIPEKKQKQGGMKKK